MEVKGLVRSTHFAYAGREGGREKRIVYEVGGKRCNYFRGLPIFLKRIGISATGGKRED